MLPRCPPRGGRGGPVSSVRRTRWRAGAARPWRCGRLREGEVRRFGRQRGQRLDVRGVADEVLTCLLTFGARKGRSAGMSDPTDPTAVSASRGLTTGKTQRKRPSSWGKRALRVGAPDRIRTCGLRLRRPTLHLVELRALLRSEAGLRGRQSTNLANPGGKASPTDERARAPHAECALQASSRRTGASEVPANRAGGPGPRRSRHTVPTAASVPHLASSPAGFAPARRIPARPLSRGRRRERRSAGTLGGPGERRRPTRRSATRVRPRATGPQYHSAPAGCASGPPAPLEGRTGRARGPSPDAGLGELFGLRARVDPIWTLSGDPETSAHIDNCSGIQCFRGGAEGQNRTADTMIFSHVLYRLSYLGTSKNTRCAFRPTTAQSAGAECVAQRRYQHIPQRNCGATGARVGPRGRAVHR